MNFKQAAKKLNELAGGEYNSLTSYVSQYPRTNHLAQEYKLYVAGHGHFTGGTWEEAFDKLTQAITTHTPDLAVIIT